MKVQLTDSIWLNDTQLCRIDHLAEVSGLSVEEVEDLVESGVIAPTDPGARPHYFQLRYIVTVKTARRLRDDFQLDRHGVSLALTLLRRIDELEAELTATQAKQDGRTALGQGEPS